MFEFTNAHARLSNSSLTLAHGVVSLALAVNTLFLFNSVLSVGFYWLGVT